MRTLLLICFFLFTKDTTVYDFKPLDIDGKEYDLSQYKGKKILSEESVNEMMKVMTSPSIIKYAPEVAQGNNYALGAWVLEEKDGKATALACPGLFGTWPVVDFCRKYAYLVFVKNLITEERAEVQKELLGLINKDIQANCP